MYSHSDSRCLGLLHDNACLETRHPDHRRRELQSRQPDYSFSWASSKSTCKDATSEGSVKSDGSSATSTSNNHPIVAASNSTSTDQCVRDLVPGAATQVMQGNQRHKIRREDRQIPLESQEASGEDRTPVSRSGAVNLETAAQHERHITCAGEAYNQELRQSPFDEFEVYESSLQEFEKDPAHEFWTWDQGQQQWFHQDEETGSMIWCPNELD